MKVMFEGSRVEILSQVSELFGVRVAEAVPPVPASVLRDTPEGAVVHAPTPSPAPTPEKPPAPYAGGDWQNIFLTNTNISTRARNALNAAGYTTVGDVLANTPAQITAIDGVPARVVTIMNEILKAHGVPEWGEQAPKPAVDTPLSSVAPTPKPKPVVKDISLELFDEEEVEKDAATASDHHVPTLDFVLARLGEVAGLDGHGTKAVQDILTRVGVRSPREVPEAKWLFVIEEAEKLISQAAA